MAPVVEGIQFLERLGFADIVLWLLSFALVYGLLSHIKMPQSNVARAIIGIVTAFFVLLSAPAQLIIILSSMSTGLILLVVGLLVFLMFISLADIGKLTGSKKKVKEGDKEVEKIDTKSLYSKRHHHAHPEVFAVLLIIFAILIFVAAGGLNLLGLNILLNSSSSMTLVVLGVIILAVYWLVKEKQ